MDITGTIWRAELVRAIELGIMPRNCLYCGAELRTDQRAALTVQHDSPDLDGGFRIVWFHTHCKDNVLERSA